MQIKPLRNDLVNYLKRRGLEANRVDRKYRAIFIKSGNLVEVVDINDHYQR